MWLRRRFPGLVSPLVEGLLIALGIAALACSAVRARPYDRLTEDEREYLCAAANLARHGVLSFATPGDAPPRPDAFREPGYPLLLAAAWRTAGLAPPASAAEVAAFFSAPARYGAIRWLHLLLLASAAGASGWTAWRLGGRRAGAVAFLLVAASPALQERAGMVMTELVAATLLALFAAALVAVAQQRRGGLLTLIVLAGLLPLFRAEALLLLPLVALAAAGSRRGEPGAGRWRFWRAVLGALVVAALPAACWMARNQVRLAAPVLSDRSGLALAVRAGLDAEVARIGIEPAMLGWTPLESAKARARALAPTSTLLDYRWVGPGNFFTRAIRDWLRDRSAPGADALAVDRHYRSAALQRFRSHPRDHVVAALAVGWRGLFAELSPALVAPFDLRFAIGVLQLTAIAIFAVRAMARRDSARLALLLPLFVLFSFHVFATEFLPRYAQPLLPCAWGVVAVVLFGGGHGSPERTAPRG